MILWNAYICLLVVWVRSVVMLVQHDEHECVFQPYISLQVIAWFLWNVSFRGSTAYFHAEHTYWINQKLSWHLVGPRKPTGASKSSLYIHKMNNAKMTPTIARQLGLGLGRYKCRTYARLAAVYMYPRWTTLHDNVDRRYHRTDRGRASMEMAVKFMRGSAECSHRFLAVMDAILNPGDQGNCLHVWSRRSWSSSLYIKGMMDIQVPGNKE